MLLSFFNKPTLLYSNLLCMNCIWKTHAGHRQHLLANAHGVQCLSGNKILILTSMRKVYFTHCIVDIAELLMQRSVLALVNGEPWDMHRPLTQDCELQFLHFKDEDPHICNRVHDTHILGVACFSYFPEAKLYMYSVIY